MSIRLQITFKKAVYIWKFMPTQAFSSLSNPSTVWSLETSQHYIMLESQVSCNAFSSQPVKHIVSRWCRCLIQRCKEPFGIATRHNRCSLMHIGLFSVHGQHTMLPLWFVHPAVHVYITLVMFRVHIVHNPDPPLHPSCCSHT